MAEAEEEPKEKSGPSVLKIVLLTLIPVLLIISTVVGLWVGGVFGGKEPADDALSEEEQSQETVGPAIYISLDPAFVVNFAAGERARFLQVSVDVMTRRKEVEEQVKVHMPVIRNNLVLLFSSQTYEGVSTLEGKEALREEALSVIQQILEEETGDPGVEAVYFTSFVMQ